MNSDKIGLAIWGDDGGEDAGEGGPNVEGETKECGGSGELGDVGVIGRDCMVGVGGIEEKRLEELVSGVGGPFWTDCRFVVLIARPLDCRAFTRSTTLPPDLPTRPSSYSTLSVLKR